MLSWLRSWRERRGAFHDLERMTRAEAALLSLDDANPLQRSKMALESGDRDGARHYFEQARVRIPAYVQISPDTVTILLGLGDIDELEGFTREGLKRFPRKSHFWEGFAMAAERRRDFAEAVRRWATVRRKFPLGWQAYAHGANCLRELGQLDHALRIVRGGMRKLPEDVRIAFEGGRIIEGAEDWAGLLQFWQPMHEKHSIGCGGYAYALFRLGRRAEAEAELEKGRGLFHIDMGLEIMAARIAREAGDMEGAAKRLEMMRTRFPLDAGAHLRSLHFLRDQKSWGEAESVAVTAIERFPKEEWPRAEYAFLAEIQGDWPLAADRWRALREAFPAHHPAWEREAAALDAAGLPTEADQLRAQEKVQFSPSPSPG